MILDINGDRKVNNPTKDDIRTAVLSLDAEKSDTCFIILSASDGASIQSGGDKTIGFDFEYLDGISEKPHRAANEDFTADQIIEIFFDYSRGGVEWKKALSSPAQAAKPRKTKSRDSSEFEGAWLGFVFLLAWGGLVGWAGFRGLIDGHISLNGYPATPKVDSWIYWGIVAGSLLLGFTSIGLGTWLLTYYYRKLAGANQPVSMKRRLRLLGNILWFSGAGLALFSSVDVYNGWRIAANASSYRAATIRIEKVEYSRTGGRHASSSLVGYGTVDGVEEKIGLREFAPEAMSQHELEAAIPRGTILDVWHDPSAARIMTQGLYLSFLPRSYPIQHAVAVAVKRTLAWDSALILGLVLFAFTRKKPE